MLIHFHNFILIGFFGNPMHSIFIFFAFKNAILRGVHGHHQLPRVLWQVHTHVHIHTHKPEVPGSLLTAGCPIPLQNSDFKNLFSRPH